MADAHYPLGADFGERKVTIVSSPPFQVLPFTMPEAKIDLLKRLSNAEIIDDGNLPNLTKIRLWDLVNIGFVKNERKDKGSVFRLQSRGLDYLDYYNQENEKGKKLRNHALRINAIIALVGGVVGASLVPLLSRLWALLPFAQ